MPRPQTLHFGPFTKGLVTSPDATLLTENGLTVARNVDMSAGVLKGFYGPGAAVETLASYPIFIYYAANDTWLTNYAVTNWAFDDASTDTTGSRITYRSNRQEDGTTEFPTVIVGANEYRLGMDAPGGSPSAATGGSGGSRSYAVTFYDSATGIESNPKVIGSVANYVGAVLSSIPTFSSTDDPDRTGVTRRLYGTQAGDSSGIKYRIVNATTGADPLNNNTTTSFTDGATYTILEAAPLDWGDGGTIDNDVMPYDHRPALRLTVLPNAMHSVNEGQGNQGSGIVIAGMDNWLCWSMLGYPHYWPAVNQMRLENYISAIITVDAETFVFTEGAIFSVSGVADYALNVVKTSAAVGVPSKYGKTVVKTPVGILYLSDEGLMVFDGNTSRPFLPDALLPYDLKAADAYGFASATYYQGFYFLSLITGDVFTIDLRDASNPVVTTTYLAASAFHVSKVTVDSVGAGLWTVDNDYGIVPWRPLDRDLITGATRQAFRAKTGHHTQGSPTLKKRYNRVRIYGEGSFEVKFYLDGSATPVSPTFTTAGQHWLPSGLVGYSLQVEVYSSDGTGVVKAIEVDTEVYA